MSPRPVPPASRRAKRQPGRAAALVALLLAGTFLGLAPTAQAADDLVIRFNHDPVPNPEESVQTDLPPPNYLQVEQVGITVRNTGGQPWVRVRCLTECRDASGAEYFARWNGAQLRFPIDFNQPGPTNTGRNAIADGVPKYNGTWETAVLISPNAVARTFNVWLMDVYTSPNMTVQPGERHVIWGRGYAPHATISVRIDHRRPDGSFETVLSSTTGRSISNGQFFMEWTVPKTEAQRVIACGRGERECGGYRLTVSGGGKESEEINFQLAPARLKAIAYETTSPNGAPRLAERTQNLTAAFDFRYPGGNVFQGAALTPADLPTSPGSPTPRLRVQIERFHLNNDTIHFIGEANMTLRAERFRWEVSWTVPKDLPVSGTADRYRMRIPETRDIWGNRIPETTLGNFTITAARMAPTIVESPSFLPRTEAGRVALRVAYHDGTLWTPRDNATALRGCFYRDNDATPPSCTGRTTVDAVHEPATGLWVFTTRYGRTYENLDAHRFVMMGGTQARDHWDNTINATAPAAFLVVPGSPRIEFRTVMRGFATDTLERGNRINVHATVTYGDGAPYNRSVASNNLPVITSMLVKRGPAGDIQSETPFNLSEVDSQTGRYAAFLDLTRDDQATPLGNWSFRFDVADNLPIPNRNRTEFFRDVVQAPILIQPFRQPTGRAATGTTVQFRFALLYDDGMRVPAEAVGSRLSAHLMRHNGTAPFGDPVSGQLVPYHDPVLDLWIIEYTIPHFLFAGRYGFVVNGEDRYGNFLQQGAWSAAFTTYAETRVRSVPTQPSPTVARGESAAVVFDGLEGDVGPDGRDVPLIRLERYDAAAQEWVIERRNVRAAAPDGEDHLGVHPILETTTIGIYRFVLEGRDRTLNLVTATSRNFTVLPTEVTRAIVEDPPMSVIKGELFTFAVERRGDDRINAADVLFNGRNTPYERPILVAAGERWNVTWRVPFDAPAGNYTLVLRGFDVFGNEIRVRSPAFEARPTTLSGKIIGNPPRTVLRGESVGILFGVTYPTGAFFLAPDVPDVFVHAASGPVGQAELRRQGLTFEATWVPPASAPQQEYWFEISGEGATGNSFPTLESRRFTVAPGDLTRQPLEDVPPFIDRLGTAILTVPYGADDRSVAFTLAYLGPASDPNAAGLADRDPVSSTALVHRFEPQAGRYVARFATDIRATLGAYRILMEGEDDHGNRINLASRVFIVRPTPIVVQWDAAPQSKAFAPGETMRLSFTARYANGPIFDDTMGRPSAVILLNQPGGRSGPITERPDLEYADGRWRISWTVPSILPDGGYSFSVGGNDFVGNGILTSTTTEYPWTTPIRESFAQVFVPGFDGVLGLLAALGAAVLFTAFRKKTV